MERVMWKGSIALAALCSLGVLAWPAMAQSNRAGENGANGAGAAYGNGGAAGYGGGYAGGRNNAGANGAGNNGGGAGNGESAARTGAGVPNRIAAAVPQYSIADADIFTGSALYTAQVMSKEGSIDVESPQLLREQAEYLQRCIDRASRDVAAVNGNAVRTNPSAVMAVRNTQGELQAAIGEANQFRQALVAGGIGPTYRITLQGVIGNLHGAAEDLAHVAKDYPGTPEVLSANFATGGSAMGGGATKAVATAGPANGSANSNNGTNQR